MTLAASKKFQIISDDGGEKVSPTFKVGENLYAMDLYMLIDLTGLIW